MCTDDRCDETADACLHLPIDRFCLDGFFCTIRDYCVDGVCQGEARTCDDHLACTIDACDEEQDLCTNAPSDALCDNQDRCLQSVCDPGAAPTDTGCAASDNGLCGACCHHVSGECTDAALSEECSNAEDSDQFFQGATCAEVLATGECIQYLGACCDSDPFKFCKVTARSECTCSTCIWHNVRTCDEVDCPSQPIPTLSHWGLVALTLLVLTGAKIAFSRRRPELNRS
jgi:hypothetical protein